MTPEDIRKGQRWIHKPDDSDGHSCISQVINAGEPVLDGWELTPPEFILSGPFYKVDGQLTRVKPQAVIDIENAQIEQVAIEEKINKKMREIAIADLKASGEIPSNYKDKN